MQYMQGLLSEDSIIEYISAEGDPSSGSFVL